MAWDFTTEPEFAELLEWAESFVTDKVYKVDALWPHDNYKPTADLTAEQRAVIGPLKAEVRKRGLAKQVLRGYKPSDGLWPSEYIPARKVAAEAELLGRVTES